MNWDQVTGKWDQFKGSVKQKWGKLTDDDLTVIAGSRDKLVGKIEERYGITKELAEQQIQDWNAAGDDLDRAKANAAAAETAERARRKAS